MKNLFQNLVTLFSALIILAFVIYTAFWFYIAGIMNRAVDTIWTHQAEYLITITGAEPKAAGFPAPPKLTFSGSVTDSNGITYASPEFSYQGFPISSQAITLNAPQGLDFSGPIFKKSIHLDDFHLRVRIPVGFPDRYDQQTLQSWQQRGGSLPIEDLSIARASLKLTGNGYLNLDKKLQPAGELAVKLTGLDDLLNELVGDGTIGKREALMAQSIINLMSQKDATTGESVVATGLRIVDSGVYLGPLRVASLPEWRWKNAQEGH